MKQLHELAVDLFTAKRAEDEAKKLRIEAEMAIATLVETGDNGSKTVDAGEGLKVVVKRKMNYKADIDAIMALNIPKLLSPIVVTPPVPEGNAFDEKAYEELRENHPETFKAISKYVTATPSKVSVTLKL